MDINYLEEQILTKDLFTHEEYLELNYLPDILLHREQELIMLSKIFVKILENPYLVSRKVTIQGEIGIGKTAIAKTFGKMLLLSAKKRELKIKYVHINCRKDKTPYTILNRIIAELNCKIPIRGFSPQELMQFLENYLSKSGTYLVLTLDELNYLEQSDFNLIYSICRFNEASLDRKNYISLIVIVRNIALLGNLDDSTKSTLQGNVLSLKQYRKFQIVDILQERVKIALKPNVFSDRLIDYIAGYIETSGDIRKGLNIIKNAAKVAESLEMNNVNQNIVDSAVQNLIPNLQTDVIDILNPHQLILFYNILTCVIENCVQEISFSEIKENYIEICSEFGEIPRKNTQLWLYLQLFEKYKLIKINTVSKNIKGRKSFISVLDLPVIPIYKEIKNKLRTFNLTV